MSLEDARLTGLVGRWGLLEGFIYIPSTHKSSYRRWPMLLPRGWSSYSSAGPSRLPKSETGPGMIETEHLALPSSSKVLLSLQVIIFPFFSSQGRIWRCWTPPLCVSSMYNRREQLWPLSEEALGHVDGLGDHPWGLVVPVGVLRGFLRRILMKVASR